MGAKQIKTGGEKLRTLSCCFFLPALLMLTVYGAIGIYPFGDKSLLIIDMNSEYVDYLAQMNESLRTGGSLMRSWNMGLGLNMMGLIAFYTASPLNALVMLFPVEWITEVIFAITVLKMGLAGLCHGIYTRALFRRLPDLGVVAFATAYAAMSYNIAYASNIMWLDGVACLPLVLLGAERILRENRYGLFLGSLVYVFFSSYYIGYMIGLFSFLYFTAVYCTRRRPLRRYLRKLAGFLGAAALAAGCCAFLLIPAFLNLKHGQSQMWDIPLDFTLNRGLVPMASRMLPGVYDSLTDSGYPNVYCSVLALLFCALYFAHKGVPRREKAVLGAFLGFMLLSMSCAFLDLGWHAFEEPTWFPARYSFLVSFLVIHLAARGADRAESLPTTAVGGGVLALVVLFVEIGIGRDRNVAVPTVLVGILLLLLYGVVWHGVHRRGRRACAAVGLVILCVELWGNAWVMERGLDEQFHYRTRESYTSFREKNAPLLRELQRRDDGVYRVEVVEQRNANGGMALGYNGISHYSTTTDQQLNRFLRALGYNKGTASELRFSLTTPSANGLLGIRYLLSESDPGSGYELLFEQGGVGVYRNRCAWPLAFWAPDRALQWDWEEERDNPFALQNGIYSAVSGVNVEYFTEHSDVELQLSNLDHAQMDGYHRYTPRVRDEPVLLDFRVDNPGGHDLYAYLPVWNNKFSRAQVLRDEQPVGVDLAYRNNTVLPLGQGDHILLTLELGEKTARIRDQFFYALDLAAAEQAARDLENRAVRFTAFSDRRVSGSLTAPEDGVLVTTFPYDPGWKVWIDGERVAVEQFAGVFLAVPVKKGERALEMRYTTPGFVPGCAVSAACVLGLLLWGIIRRRRPAGKGPADPNKKSAQA